MEDFLYVQVADRLEAQIRKGVLKTGYKLASVRVLSQEQGISLTTAFKAYSQLEQRGLIEARTKSGYYVRYTPRAFPDAPGAPGAGAQGASGAADALVVYEAPPGGHPALPEGMFDDSVVPFSVGAPALELLPSARLNKMLVQSLRDSSSRCLGYDQLQGNARLRRQIAALSFHWGGSLTHEEVVTTHGCMEAVLLCLRAVTKPGDTVALETPTFFGLLRGAMSLGLNILEIPGDPQSGVRLDLLENALERRQVNACLFVPNFSNPLGACMPEENKARLVRLLSNHRIPLIEDDIYGDLHFDKIRPRTCKSYDKEGMVLLCSSFSKSLAPGYRVGWCAPGRYLNAVLDLKRVQGISSTHPTHAAIGLFLESNRFDLHMRHLRKALHTQCLQYQDAITRYFPVDTRYTRPRGGYVLWVELNRTVDGYALYQAAMREKIHISPGELFSIDDRYGHCIRISFGQPFSAKVDQALKTLGKLVRQFIHDVVPSSKPSKNSWFAPYL